MKRNERDWAGQLISWIKILIQEGRTVFEDATNDTGIKLDSGITKFPDVLLFVDRISGIIFNGWELKFPDTRVDDQEMLINALEKAKRIKSESFVTWNGAEAIIWKINDNTYTLKSLSKIKIYPKEPTINVRDDLAEPRNYFKNEHHLKSRVEEILHDLEQLFQNGELRPAINITDELIQSIIEASKIIIPQFKTAIISEKGRNPDFRSEFNKWKIYESSTLKILSYSSRRAENVSEEEVLAKFTFYNLIGKILFYLTLSENLTKELSKIQIRDKTGIKVSLNSYFDKAKEIDYQAVFKPYFTDSLDFSHTVNDTIYRLLETFTEFDFKVLPSGVIGTILENLVPKSEKQKFGQYFTPECLANLVSFPAIQTCNDIVFDPTSGTGTFLNSFYRILKYHGKKDHSELLSQIWGNDISHFPAILSVINLYKQNVTITDNFPRVTRDDFFNLEIHEKITFPDSKNYKKQIELEIPKFNAIASNFPFIQQEDIPNDILTSFFREKFEKSQRAFLQDSYFKINERSDYFTYCVYNSIRFLKDDSYLSAITSNAWLGKDYGIQFKKFLLDNFHIKYIVRSNAEHWFLDSKVSTIFTVLQKGKKYKATKFITLNFKLTDRFDQTDINNQLAQIENFYSEIDNCQDPRNPTWRIDTTFDDLYHNLDDSISVALVPYKILVDSINSKDSWSKYFISSHLFEIFDKHLIQLYPNIIDSFRGERTGWNEMFIIPNDEINNTGIEPEFLVPYVKSPSELKVLEFSGNYEHQLFVCSLEEDELKKNYPGAYNWIKRFEKSTNRNNSKTIQEACSNHRPFWYSLHPKAANIVTAINPFERLFFCYSQDTFTIDQRLVGINVEDEYDVELIAALFNSIVTLLSIELRGTSRNLGALDLNANYFRTLQVLNPDQLTPNQINNIYYAFQPLKRRPILSIFEEVQLEDRINFDRVVLRSFGIDETILENLYQTVLTSVNDRVTMKDR